MENKINAIKDVHKVQGNKGNWDYDEYMLGLYNGLELALAILENRIPDYRSLNRTRWEKLKLWFNRKVMFKFINPIESKKYEEI